MIVLAGEDGWIVMKQKHDLQVIILHRHFGRELLPAYRETLTDPDVEESESNVRSLDSFDNIPISNSNDSQMAVSISLDNLKR